MNEIRCKLLHIGECDFLALLNGFARLPVSDELPRGVSIVSLDYGAADGHVYFQVTHPTYDVVSAGEVMPAVASAQCVVLARRGPNGLWPADSQFSDVPDPIAVAAKCSLEIRDAEQSPTAREKQRESDFFFGG